MIERSDAIAVGIDGGGLDDILGLAIIGRDPLTGEWLCWFRGWIHEVVLERRQSEASKLRDFAEAGDLVIVPDASEQDVEDVAELVGQVYESGKLNKVGVDPAGVGTIVDALTSEDGCALPADLIVGIAQGWKLMGAIKQTERKLAAELLRHTGSPFMAWVVSNAKWEPKGNAALITKQASGTGKIDPLMAGFNAVSVLALAPPSNVVGEDYSLTVA